MKQYSVAMLFKKTEQTNAYTRIDNEGLCLRIVMAVNQEAAFGLAYDSAQSYYKSWNLSAKVVVEVPNNDQNVQECDATKPNSKVNPD